MIYRELGEIVKLRSENIKDNKNPNLLYVSTTNMNPNKTGIDITSNNSIDSSGKRFQEGDVLVSNIRPYFKKIWKADRDGFSSADVLNFIPRNDAEINKTFLFYLLSNDEFFAYMMSTSKGTKMPRGDKEAIKKYRVPLFTIEEQDKIANLLSSFDDKIGNNNAIIANLEEQAQTIFKSWFVDFEFPDENEMPYKSNGGTMIESQIGRIPEIWRISTIENFSDKLISGGTPSRKIDEYWNDGHIPWLKTQEINNGYITQVEEKITNEGLNKSSAKWVKKDSIAIAMYGASAGRIAYLGLPTTTNQACCVIESDYSNYIYEYLLNKQKYISSLASGSAQQNLSKKVISEIKIINPSHAILEKYETHIKVNTRLILNLIKENRKLAEIREMILPKLMSGEIRVGDVDTVE